MSEPIRNIFDSYHQAISTIYELTGGLVVIDWITGLLCICALILLMVLFKKKYMASMLSDNKNAKWQFILFVLAFCFVAFLLGKCYGEFDFVRHFLRN